MPDIPQYVIKPSTARIIVPKILLTSLLGLLFYAGIVVNVFLLGLEMPSSVTLLILVVLSLMIVIQNILSYLQISKTRYMIFSNRIQVEGISQQYGMLNTVTNITQKKNFFDNLFKTGTIMLEPGIKLEGIPNFDQMFSYLNQVVQYARTQYYEQ